MICSKRTFFTPCAPMLFAARGRGILLIMPRPLSGCQIKAEIQGFLLMYRLFLYQLWFVQKIEKGQRIFFLKFHHFQEIAEIIFFENFPPAFFNILKELLLIQKQTIHQQKALDLSFNLKPQKWAWHYQEGATPSRREKHILLNFMAGAADF